MRDIEQVLPFLGHGDELVAQLAAGHLIPRAARGEFSVDRIIDCTPPARRFNLHKIDDCPLTGHTLDALIDAYRDVPENRGGWIPRVISNAPAELLTPDRLQAIRSNPNLKYIEDDVRQQLEYASMSDDQLREALLQACEAAEEQDDNKRTHSNRGFQIASALARRPGTDEWALEHYDVHEGMNSWTEIIVRRCLVETRSTAASRILDLLPETDEDDDWLFDDVGEVIASTGEAGDVDRYYELFTKCGHWKWYSLLGAFSKLRFDGAGDLLRRCASYITTESRLPQDAKATFLTFVAEGLCQQLSDDEASLEFVRKLTQEVGFDIQHMDLEELAIPLGIIIGRPFAEESEWRSRIEDQGERNQARTRLGMQQMQAASLRHIQQVQRGRVLLDVCRKSDPSGVDVQWQTPKQDASRSGSSGLQLVTEAKVGRNDSCPCGSGKKFKKCCGK